MHSPKVFRFFFSRMALTGVVLLTAVPALARPEAPGQLQVAADMQCVPLCTMCHSGNPGTKSNWDPGHRQLAAILSGPISAQTDIKDAYNAWAAANPTLAALVKQGKEPSSGQDVCGPTYGCAVHVAKEAAAPRDFTGPLWAVGAMVTAGLLRRRRRASAR